MKARIILSALAAVLCAAVASAREPNYDEAKVAPYTLEDPLTFADGRKLKDASEWPALSGYDWLWMLDFADKALSLEQK